MRTSGFSLFFFLFVLLSSVMPCGAVDTNWIGTVGDWSDANQWDNGVPTPDWRNNVYIDNGGEAQVTQDTGLVGHLYVGYSSGGSGTVTQSAGEYSSYYAGDSSERGSLARIYLGYTSGSTGTYNMNGSGATLTLGAEGVENTSGGSPGWLRVGQGGTGQFMQSDGSVDVHGDVNIGYTFGDNGQGTYVLSGGVLNVSGYWDVYSEFVCFDPEFPDDCWEEFYWNYIDAGIDVNNGDFQQTDGTVNSRLLKVQNKAGTAVYDLSGSGQLFTESEVIGNQASSGTFIHSGGLNSTSILTVGYGWNNTGDYLYTGRYELSGAGALTENILYIGKDNYGTGEFIQDGGTHTSANTVNIGYNNGSRGTYTISAGSLSTPNLFVGQSSSSRSGSSGTLNITSAAADITVSNNLTFGANSVFTAVPGSTIRMTGSRFVNSNTDPADLSGLSGLELIFEGGSEDIDPFEAAGADMGAVLPGFYGNFALGTLALGSADIGQVQLVDIYDNSSGTEAVYVFNLNLGSGSVLDLNGINLYYLNGAIDPGATILLNGGELIQLDTGCDDFPGTGPDDDLDGIANTCDNCINVPNGPDIPDAGGNIQFDTDGDGYGNVCDPDTSGSENIVGLEDFNDFRASWLKSAGDPAYNPDCDYDGDGVVGLPDFNIFRSFWLGAPGPSGLVP